MSTNQNQLVTLYMRSFLGLLLALLFALPQNVSACERNVQSDNETYIGIVSELFDAGFDEAVLFRIITFPSFGKESIVGIRTSGDLFETFTLAPEIPIRQYTQLREYEDGERSTGPDGAVIGLEDDPIYLYLKKTTPRYYQEINIEQCSRVLDSHVARYSTQALNLLMPKLDREEILRIEIDGNYYLIATIDRNAEPDVVNEYIGSGQPIIAQLESLIKSLSGFCTGKVDQNTLLSEIEMATKIQLGSK